MKFLKYIFFILLIAIIAVSIYVAVQPSNFEVSRTRIINAPSGVVYNNVADLKLWENWSPWKEKDQTMKIMYNDQTKGVGASYSWTGKDGNGNMKIVNTNPPKSIEHQLQFEDYDPSKINWTFTPTNDGKTEVKWQMNSENIPFMFKAFGLMSGGFDKMIGPDFERGLEKLDSVTTTQIRQYNIEVNGVTEHSGGYYLYNTTSCKISDFQKKMAEMLPKVGQFVAENNITVSGSAFVIYHKWDEENNTVMFSCAMPTPNKVVTTTSDILTGQLEPFKAVKTTLKGDYSNLKEAWDKGMKYIEQYNLVFDEDGVAIESYVTDPSNEPNPAKWITEIYMPVE